MGTSPSAGDVALPSRSSSPILERVNQDLFSQPGDAAAAACASPASAAHWKLNSQLVCKDVAIARLRNEPRDELKLIIHVSEYLPCNPRSATHLV